MRTACGPHRALMALSLGLVLGCGGEEAPRSVHPPSPVIASVQFDLSTLTERAQGSDNWAITWADDDAQYTTWGDGGGFGGTNQRGRVSLGVARVQGPADGYRAENVWGGHDAPHPAPFTGKAYGIASIEGTLYLWRTGDASTDTAFRFQELWAWEEPGAAWERTGVDFRPEDFPRSRGFFAPTFLQFGRGYRGSRDRSVYVYAPENHTGEFDVQRPGEIALLRAPRERIEEEEAYEFFAGTEEGTPVWTDRPEEREPVFSDPRNGVMRTSVTYNRGLDRYLLVTQQISSFREQGAYLGIYDAPEPWGPWTTVLFADPWELGLETGDTTVFWNFSNKWTSDDGRRSVLVYTGPTSDNWGTVEVRFVLRSAEGSGAAP